MNSDFTSKVTSLWLSGICTVLIASIKLSVDCSLHLDLSDSVRGCIFSSYVGDPQNETIGLIGILDLICVVLVVRKVSVVVVVSTSVDGNVSECLQVLSSLI